MLLTGETLCCLIFIPGFFILSVLSVPRFAQISNVRFLTAFFSTGLLAFHARRKNLLNPSANAVAVFVGFAICVSSPTMFLALVVFFLLGSQATKKGQDRKRTMIADTSKGRTWAQVLCNGGFPTMAALTKLWLVGPAEFPTVIAIHRSPLSSVGAAELLSSACSVSCLASLACCLGDTLASELGPLCSASAPVLITRPWRRVPAGCNGGITSTGVLWSAVGGAIIGIVFTISGMVLGGAVQPALLLIGIIAGSLGSALDSVLGAECQESRFDERLKVIDDVNGTRVISGKNLIDNSGVNLISSGLMAVAIPVWWLRFFV